MKIFFTGSTSNLKKDKSKFSEIITIIDSLGHRNTNYIHFPRKSKIYREATHEMKTKKISLYDYCISLINKSDVLIADIATPSMKVGYQVDYALNQKIPSLVLYKKTKGFVLPVVFRHSHYGLLKVREYKSTDDIKGIVNDFFKTVKTGKIKFNFYLSLELHNYLSQRAKKEKKHKSTVVRDILEKEVKNNPLK